MDLYLAHLCSELVYDAQMANYTMVLYHNKNSNYIKMLHFELYMINKAPETVQLFIFNNLFQRNKNHNNQNTAQGIDYKLEEYNKLFKTFEFSPAPSIDDWIRVASSANQFQCMLQNQSNDYELGYGIYSEPGAPDYKSRVDCCTKMIRQTEFLKSTSTVDLKNCDGKKLDKKKTFNYEKEFQERKTKYLELVIEHKSFIKAELDFDRTELTF